MLVFAAMSWSSRWNRSHKSGWSSGKWWTCQDPACCAARRANGRQPWQNPPSAYSCEVCFSHWQAAKAPAPAVQAAQKQLTDSKSKVAKQGAKPTYAAAVAPVAAVEDAAEEVQIVSAAKRQ